MVGWRDALSGQEGRPGADDSLGAARGFRGAGWIVIEDADRTSGSRIVLRPVASFEELQSAYKLVYQTYLRNGYTAPNPSEMRFSYFNALPDAVTFVGVLRERVIATMSLLPDTSAGLPMDQVDVAYRLCKTSNRSRATELLIRNY